MTPRGRKAKGRQYQQQVRDMLLELLPGGGFESLTMGLSGSDIIDRQSRLPWAYTECRRIETWPSLTAIVEEMKKAGPAWAYTAKKSRQPPVWVVPEGVMELLLRAWFDKGSKWMDL